MSLQDRLRRSILFDPSKAEELNVMAQKVDARFFCFAYYSPMPCPEEFQPRLVFHTAVRNLYGLLWDCGPHMVIDIMKPLCKRGIKGSPALCTTDSFCRALNSIRTVICHNASPRLFFNARHHEELQKFLEPHAIAGSDNKTVIQWSDLLEDFLARTEDLIDSIKKFLNVLAKNPHLKACWLNILQKWYEEEENLLLHVLADRYKLKLLDKRKPVKPITRQKVKDWVNRAMRHPDDYGSYRKKCAERIKPLLQSSKCPTPAVPLKVFAEITKDAGMFAL